MNWELEERMSQQEADVASLTHEIKQLRRTLQAATSTTTTTSG